MQVDIILFAGFDELDALGPFEVLQNAAELGADFRVRLVSPSGVGEVVGAHGLHVRVEARLREDPQPDLVVVPGGGWNDRDLPPGMEPMSKLGLVLPTDQPLSLAEA